MDQKKATRPLEMVEYKKIIEMINSGYEYQGKKVRKAPHVSLILQLQASLGLRIGDILNLTPNNFRNGKLEKIEQKTGKLQYKELNTTVIQIIQQYAIDNNIKSNQKLFNIGTRAVQKQLKQITNLLELDNISTHSFRKLYAMTIYKNNENDIYLVKELLNHTSIATTQKYLDLNEEEKNKASSKVNMFI